MVITNNQVLGIVFLLSNKISGGTLVLEKIFGEEYLYASLAFRSNGVPFQKIKFGCANILKLVIQVLFSKRKQVLVYTHIATLPLVLILGLNKRHCQVWLCQGLEWQGVGMLSPLQSLILRFCASRVRILVVSNVLAERLNDFGQNTTVIPYPSLLLKDIDFNPSPRDKKILIHFRNQSIRDPSKLGEIIHMLGSRLDGFEILVVGIESDVIQLEKCEHRIKAVAEMPRNQYIKYLNDAKYFMYYSKFEGFSLPAFEAIMLGVIPVGPNVGALNMILDKAYIGWASNPDDYVQAILKIENDDSKILRELDIARKKIRAIIKYTEKACEF